MLNSPGPGATHCYDRLQDMIAVLDDMLRENRQATASPATLGIMNDMLDLARRAFARTPGMPRFSPLPEHAALTHFDMQLFVRWLAGICCAHEERRDASAEHQVETGMAAIVHGDSARAVDEDEDEA